MEAAASEKCAQVGGSKNWGSLPATTGLDIKPSAGSSPTQTALQNPLGGHTLPCMSQTAQKAMLPDRKGPIKFLPPKHDLQMMFSKMHR